MSAVNIAKHHHLLWVVLTSVLKRMSFPHVTLLIFRWCERCCGRLSSTQPWVISAGHGSDSMLVYWKWDRFLSELDCQTSCEADNYTTEKNTTRLTSVKSHSCSQCFFTPQAQAESSQANLPNYYYINYCNLQNRTERLSFFIELVNESCL